MAVQTCSLDAVSEELQLLMLRPLLSKHESTRAALACKLWLELSGREWEHRTKAIAPEGVEWKPSLALKLEQCGVDASTMEWSNEERVSASCMERVSKLPIVNHDGQPWLMDPWGSAAMWVFTKPNTYGGQQICFGQNGAETSGCQSRQGRFY